MVCARGKSPGSTAQNLECLCGSDQSQEGDEISVDTGSPAGGYSPCGNVIPLYGRQS